MKIISKETSKRVCDHMNNDHIDSVHKYLIHYGKISRFENAYMEEINNSYIKINYDGQSAIINFKNEITEETETKKLVKISEFLEPKKFPKNPEMIAPIKGRKIIRYSNSILTF